MADDVVELNHQIAIKKNEWIHVRTAELQGIGSAERSQSVKAEWMDLESRKKRIENSDKSIQPESDQNVDNQRSQIGRKMRMMRSR